MEEPTSLARAHGYSSADWPERLNQAGNEGAAGPTESGGQSDTVSRLEAAEQLSQTMHAYPEPQPTRSAFQIVVMGMCVMVAIVLVLVVVLSAIYTYPVVRDLEVFPLTLLFLFAMIGTPVPLFKIAYFIFRFALSEPDTNMQNPRARKRAGRLVFKIGIELQAEAFFLLFLPVFIPFLIWTHSMHFLVAYLVALVTTYFVGVFMEFKGEKMVRVAGQQQKNATQK